MDRMKAFLMGNKYKALDKVYERIRPQQKLIVSKCVDGLYYCTVQELRNRKSLVFFESELMPASEDHSPNYH